MSREKVEMWRASTEDACAGISRDEFNPEATISKMAGLWHPEIEWDVSEAAFDTSGAYRTTEAVGQASRQGFVACETPQFGRL